MLTEQRHELILKMLEEKGSVSVGEIRDRLNISESTVRRDITILDQAGRLVKVFGGAISAAPRISAREDSIMQKSGLNQEAKRRIGRYAASLIEPGDFIYLDAGTTTGWMLEGIAGAGVTVVTNAVSHAKALAALGVRVLLVGGELKSTTEAMVGAQANRFLQDFHFTKGFFGANGVTVRCGCTTPDPGEAAVKRTALEQCRQAYVLCDASKFDQISPVTFAGFEAVTLITDRVEKGFEDCRNILKAPD